MIGLFRVLAVTVMAVAVVAAPAPAQTSGGFPGYVLEEDGTVVIEGDAGTDCASFASFLEQGYFEPGGISPGAQRVLDQCVEAGLLDPGLANPAGAPASGEGGGLPETGGPDLPALLLAVLGVLATTGVLLARKAGKE